MTLARLMAALTASLLALTAAVAAAHEIRPGGIAYRELSPGAFVVRVTPPQTGGGLPIAFSPPTPEGCVADEDLLRCPDGLRAVEVPAVGTSSTHIVVGVTWLDERRFERLVVAGIPHSVSVDGDGGHDVSGAIRAGVLHFAKGWDHIAFLACLLLLAGGAKRALWATLAFGVAHGVAMPLAPLVPFSGAAVELLIAASVAGAAAATLHTAPSGAASGARFVAACAAVGLLHGLGFGSAVPSPSLTLWLSIGAALAQLDAVLVALLLLRLARPVLDPRPRTRQALRTAVAYLCGTAGAAWTLDRLVGWLG